ncbi:HEPN domain-containing protein [Deinococcus peraridilitoris]|uniref:HEPN domain-containing protein n=1 Tax=Deinococcus peraridilitoris TaxID=432329 RepID=UPI000A009313
MTSPLKFVSRASVNMPQASEHYGQADSNERFISDVDDQRFPDWAITSRYYEAVHLVRAWLAERGEDSFPDHSTVRRLLRDKGFPRAAKEAYKDLEQLSQDARYECYDATVLAPDIADAQHHLEVIRRVVRPRRQPQ